MYINIEKSIDFDTVPEVHEWLNKVRTAIIMNDERNNNKKDSN